MGEDVVKEAVGASEASVDITIGVAASRATHVTGDRSSDEGVQAVTL
jgi:hypothetical protein